MDLEDDMRHLINLSAEKKKDEIISALKKYDSDISCSKHISKSPAQVAFTYLKQVCIIQMSAINKILLID